MAKAVSSYLIRLLLLFTLVISSYAIQVSRRNHQYKRFHHSFPSQRELLTQNYRRLMIGSTAPTCTYNECRGCRYKCRAEQVPVEGNDPNSAYHYRCVCNRIAAECRTSNC